MDFDWATIKEVWPVSLVVGAALIRNERGHWNSKARNAATNARLDSALAAFEQALKDNKEAMQSALSRIERTQAVTNADIKHLLERGR